MSTKSFNYDHPAYLVRVPNSALIASGGGVTVVPVVALAPQNAYTATFHVITAGTSASTNKFVVSLLSGTSSTALGTATLGTTAAGGVVQLGLSATAGGVAMLLGDAIEVLSGTDIVGVAAVTVDTQLAPETTVTA